MRGELEATFGEFRNVGGLSLTAVVGGTITDARDASPDFSAALDVTCQELERDVFSGCGGQTGSQESIFPPYAIDREPNLLRVETSLATRRSRPAERLWRSIASFIDSAKACSHQSRPA